MSIKSKSKIYKASGEGRKSKYLLIPSKVATDSQFLFREEVGEVNVKIDTEEDRLIIEKKED